VVSLGPSRPAHLFWKAPNPAAEEGNTGTFVPVSASSISIIVSRLDRSRSVLVPIPAKRWITAASRQSLKDGHHPAVPEGQNTPEMPSPRTNRASPRASTRLPAVLTLASLWAGHRGRGKGHSTRHFRSIRSSNAELKRHWGGGPQKLAVTTPRTRMHRRFPIRCGPLAPAPLRRGDPAPGANGRIAPFRNPEGVHLAAKPAFAPNPLPNAANRRKTTENPTLSGSHRKWPSLVENR
jgi:hypothetical protein